MNYADILTQINTLPSTFLRPGNTFGFIQTSRAAALARYAGASDGISENLLFSKAAGVWLDTWGRLFNLLRNAQESDGAYAARIPATLVSGKGTPIAIILYLLTAFDFDVTLTEDFVDPSWSIQFSVPVSSDTFNEVMEGLNYVRPAGVPGEVLIGLAGGLYVGSVNYLGAPQVTGAYLLSPHGVSNLNISAFTNNTKPLLPTTFLTDTSLNPGLA